MHDISEIKKINLRNPQAETLRLRTNYEVQQNGDVWVRHNGVLRILSAGHEADGFLTSIKKGNAVEIITNIFKA